MEVNIIFGPPGTGKTTKLLSVLEKEILKVDLSEIAYVSFTREGAYQGKRRVMEKLDIKHKDLPYFRTLHSIAFSSMNITRNDMMDKKAYKRFSELMGMKFTGFYTDNFSNQNDAYLFFDIVYRNNVKAVKSLLSTLDIQTLGIVRKNYAVYKQQERLFDYTDIVQEFIKNNKPLPVKVAIIDEAQDLTTLQWKMVLVAFKNCERLYVAGDDDQAIYQWSGADVDYFLRMKGNPIVLEKSFRLPNNVLIFASTITDQISKRIEKPFVGSGTEGTVEHLQYITDVEISKEKGSWLILSRNKRYLKEVETHIQSLGLVYNFCGKVSITKREIEVVNCLEKIRKKLLNPAHLEKIKWHLKEDVNINSPWYDNVNWKNEKIVYIRDLVANKTDLTNVFVELATIHSVKGAEADNVILLTGMSARSYETFLSDPDSEHRVFYVGATRARKALYILHNESKFNYPVRRKV